MRNYKLYGIKKNALKKINAELEKKTLFFEVSEEETIDLDNYKDFEYLKYYAKKYLRSPVKRS